MTKVSDLFEVRYGHSLELNRLISTGRGAGVAFVSRKMGDNGISAYVVPLPDVEPAPAGELSCALGGNGVLSTFIQEQSFYTGRDVARLIPLVPMSKAQLLFYCYCIKFNRYRFSYGRQANRTLKDIVVPSLSDIPAYVSEVDEDVFVGRDAPLIISETPMLSVGGWRGFQLQSLFDLKKGKRITKANLKDGNTPFISALDNNNGLRQFIDVAPNHQAGLLTVNYNGNGVAEAFYQPMPFVASDDVNVLYPKFDGMSELVGLFICVVIRMEKYRFNYGRKWNLDRMKESIIRLPIQEDGQPDVLYMEEYMASLPFSSNAKGWDAMSTSASLMEGV